MAHAKLQMLDKQPASMTAERFFTDVVPRVLAARRPMLRKLGGTYGFKIHEAGEWVLDFATGSVRTGNAASAELVIETGAAEFTRLLNGTLDVKSAHGEGRFGVSGRRSLFPNLTAALRPA